MSSNSVLAHQYIQCLIFNFKTSKKLKVFFLYLCDSMTAHPRWQLWSDDHISLAIVVAIIFKPFLDGMSILIKYCILSISQY